MKNSSSHFGHGLPSYHKQKARSLFDSTIECPYSSNRRNRTRTRAASNSPTVSGTYSFVDYDNGIEGGGPLFSNHTLGGRINFSDKNSKDIYQLQPTTWDFITPFKTAVRLNYVVRVIKDEPGGIFSFQDGQTFTEPFIPVTGEPVRLDLNQDGKIDLLLRVTLKS